MLIKSQVKLLVVSVGVCEDDVIKFAPSSR